MRILITGATGFLGRVLEAKLRSQNHDVVGLGSRDADLTIKGSLDSFNDRSYDRIYHLAAWTQAGDFCLHHPGEQWLINQKINTHVLSWWREFQPQAKLIAIGTSCSYPPHRELIEENYLVGEPIESLFTYAMTKRMLYVGLQALHRQFDLQFLHVVPSTLYGPGYHTDGRQMHFIFDLIRKIIRGKLHDEPVILWGDGHQRRELVYIDDFVEIMLRLDSKCVNELVNIGAGEEFPIRHFAKMICDRVGFPFDRIEFDLSRYVGAQTKCLSIRKLKALLPDFRMTPIDEGLSRTIDWLWKEEMLTANL